MITFKKTQWAFVYWYFNHAGISVWDDHKNPIIPSIASLRYFEPLVNIYVIDVSKVQNDWGNYPISLRFNVVPRTYSYSDISQESDFFNPISLELLSKTQDTWFFCQELNHEYIAVLDADLFFVKKPLPLHGSDTNKFWMSQHCNTGFYYYHKDEEDFIYLWRGLNNLAAHEEKFRKMVLKTSVKDKIQEEIVCQYAVKLFGCQLNRFPLTENYCLGYYESLENSIVEKLVPEIKIIHVLGNNCLEGDAVQMVNSITEIRNIMKKMFTKKQYQSIFGDPIADVSYKDIENMKKLLIF